MRGKLPSKLKTIYNPKYNIKIDHFPFQMLDLLNILWIENMTMKII
jgi:hypothetical protein